VADPVSAPQRWLQNFWFDPRASLNAKIHHRDALHQRQKGWKIFAGETERTGSMLAA
jgi:hypothetical protein